MMVMHEQSWAGAWPVPGLGIGGIESAFSTTPALKAATTTAVLTIPFIGSNLPFFSLLSPKVLTLQ